VIDLDAVYDVLVQHCGARDDDQRAWFIEGVQRQQEAGLGPVEWRFMGALGFGGKFRIAHGRVYVDCYPEDETNERRGRIAVANHLLAELADPRHPKEAHRGGV